MLSSSSAFDAARRLVATGSSVAVLLVGDEGGSQEGAAEQLARAWHCLEPNDGEACGACRACGAFDRRTSADVLRIEPSGPQDLIRLRQIIDDPAASEPNIRGFLQSPPAMGSNRVVLISRADRLTHDSANALLKTIEEPSAQARFVLTTAASGKILPTIRSRCLLIPCGSEELPPGFAATLAGGSRVTYERLSSEEFSEFVGRVEALADRCGGATRAEALSISEEFLSLASDYVALRPGEERQRRAEFVRLFANVAAARADTSDAWRSRLERLVLAHRALLGNVNAAYLADWVFAG